MEGIARRDCTQTTWCTQTELVYPDRVGVPRLSNCTQTELLWDGNCSSRKQSAYVKAMTHECKSRTAAQIQLAHMRVVLLYAAFVVLEFQRAVKHSHVVEGCEPFLAGRTDQGRLCGVTHVRVGSQL